LPPGTVLLSDASVLAEGVQDVLARIIQQQLGYQTRGRLRKEAKELSAMLLVGVGEGSGVLECITLPRQNTLMRNPASVAAFELVSSVETYNRTGTWPLNLPVSIRNRLGRAVAPVVSDSDESATIVISVQENGLARDCYIDASVEEALQEPEEFSIAEQVEVIGQMYEINRDSETFKIDTGQGRVDVRVDQYSLDTVDRLRWRRVFVSGFPVDERCRSIENVSNLRAAEENEADGITLPSEMLSVERTEALVSAKARAEEIRALPERWDSYNATIASQSTLDFALNFLRNAATMFAAYKDELPTPFLVPTSSGGVQFEWEIEGRELELEIPRPNSFQYLRVAGDEEIEDSASRWEAMRLIRWVAGGEII